MQCVNCQFHNMPGSAACGRCGSSLQLATAAIDVHPPRASAVAKQVRRLTGSRRTLGATRDALAARREQFAPFVDEMPPAGVLARAVVPGWPQWHVGQRWQGHVFFWGTLLCLLPGLVLAGSTSGGVLLGLAFSIHSWSLVDVLNQTFTDRSLGSQLGRSIAASVVLWALIYWPMARVIAGLAQPYTMGYSSTTFNEGDILIGGAWLKPSSGRAVLYDIPDPEMPRNMHEGRRYTLYSGQRIDRVLAGPGDDVRIHSGRLLVNGRPSTWLPLNRDFVLPELMCVVPADTLFILPSTTAGFVVGDGGARLLRNSLVPTERVHAVMYARTLPLSRIGRIG